MSPKVSSTKLYHYIYIIVNILPKKKYIYFGPLRSIFSHLAKKRPKTDRQGPMIVNLVNNYGSKKQCKHNTNVEDTLGDILIKEINQ